MKTNYYKKIVGGFILGLSLLGIGVMSSTTAQAQYRTNDRYERQRQREIERLRREQLRDFWRNQRGRDNRGYDNRRHDNYGYYGGDFNFRQTALNAGYNEGMKAGREDRRRGERYEFRDEGAYQSASKDYNSRGGDRYSYQRYFREAFQTGYRDGYQGYGY